MPSTRWISFPFPNLEMVPFLLRPISLYIDCGYSFFLHYFLLLCRYSYSFSVKKIASRACFKTMLTIFNTTSTDTFHSFILPIVLSYFFFLTFTRTGPFRRWQTRQQDVSMRTNGPEIRLKRPDSDIPAFNSRYRKQDDRARRRRITAVLAINTHKYIWIIRRRSISRTINNPSQEY